MKTNEKLGLAAALFGGFIFWLVTKPTTVDVGSGVLMNNPVPTTIPANRNGYIFDIGTAGILGQFVTVWRTSASTGEQAVGWTGSKTQVVGYMKGAVVTITTTAGVWNYAMG